MSNITVRQSTSVAILLRHIHNIQHLVPSFDNVLWTSMGLPPGSYQIQFRYVHETPTVNQEHQLNEDTRVMDILLLAAQMFEDLYGAIDKKTGHCLAEPPMFLGALELLIRDFSFPVNLRGPGRITTPFFEHIVINREAKLIEINMGN